MEGFRVIGSSGVMVRQEAANRARPRTGSSNRDFMSNAGVGELLARFCGKLQQSLAGGSV